MSIMCEIRKGHSNFYFITKMNKNIVQKKQLKCDTSQKHL